MSCGPRRHAPRRATRRAGTILIVTMWIVLVLAGLVLVLAQAMRVEGVCSGNESSSFQADAVEQGAVQYVLAHVDSLAGAVPSETDMPCEAVRVGDGAFWILRPNYDDVRTPAYGLVDEAAKVNLNTASVEMLTRIPDMTEELAACIVDWRDADSDVTPNGAESEYYLLLKDPYLCKDAPLETVEELFLIKGATREIVYGEDVNRNGILDANEDDASATDPPDNHDGRLDRGLPPFVTVHSAEPNTASGGGRRINVNDGPSRALIDLLRKHVSADRLGDLLVRARVLRPFRNVLDFYFRVGLKIEEFRPMADQLTTSTSNPLRGLVNVKTAPREVLACLPGLDDADASALLAKRAESGADLTSIAWVAEALPAEKAVPIGNRITVRSYQFSADIVSVAGNGRAFRRCYVVVDARNSPPKVLYRRDLTPLGWPLAPEILEKLKAGVSVEEITTGRTNDLGSMR